jgi:hypothetical protein
MCLSIVACVMLNLKIITDSRFVTAVLCNLHSMALLQNNSVTSDLRGSLNGLAMSVGSLSKAAGPAIGASLYAYSVASHNPAPFDYRLTYYVVSAATYELYSTTGIVIQALCQSSYTNLTTLCLI